MNYVQKVKVELSKKIDVESDLLDLYTLLVFTKGVECTWEDVHDAWSIWKNQIDPQHKSLIPFDELKYEVAELDEKYAKAIIATAKKIS